MQGKLIVIDGLDGSGKSTQSEIIVEKLKEQGEKVILISYPDYADKSSTLVKMYLNGEFSDNADDVNAYAAGSFYAVDRYAGYMRHWKSFYDKGYTVIAARYVSSNAIHQMVKLPENEWNDYLSWLSDYEYDKLGLPRPDMVIFLDMARKVADKLIFSRYNGDESKKDIHEKNMEYLEKCQRTAHYAAEKEGWRVVSCSDGENPYPIEKISNEIFNLIKGN